MNKKYKESDVIKKSIVLPAFFPSSMENEKDFLESIKLLKENYIDIVEFYYKGNNKENIKKYLNKYGFKSIYLAAMKAKQENLNLSSLSQEIREKSIEEIKKCIDDAYFYNSESLLVNSGKRPMIVSIDDKEKNIEAAYEYFKQSLLIILEYIEKKSKNYKLKLTLEPGDTDVDSFSLIGPTDLSIGLIKELREKYENVSLTIDTSHLLQLGEDPITSIKKTFPYCNHIHLANCIIKDKSHELYGDKHPEFGVEGGEINLNELNDMIEEIKKLYKKTDLILGLEIIYRNKNNNKNYEFNYFKNTTEKLNWI